MKATKGQQAQMPYEGEQLLQMLDKGIDDMESGREVPLEEAYI